MQVSTLANTQTREENIWFAHDLWEMTNCFLDQGGKRNGQIRIERFKFLL